MAEKDLKEPNDVHTHRSWGAQNQIASK